MRSRSELWELAHIAATSAREAEDDILALAAGVKEMDTILRQGDQGVQFDVIALARLGRYAEAAVAIERGLALGVFGSNPVEGTHARFVALDLPALTVNAVANLVATAFPDDTKR